MRITISQFRKEHFGLIALSLVCLFLTMTSVAKAQQSNSISQGFQSDNSKGQIVPGSLVSIEADNPRVVELATTESKGYLAGVVDENPVVAISADKKTQVVLNGTTQVLVSDINGPIRTGDKITISPIAGVGMRTTVDGQTIGTALSNFEAQSARVVSDRHGKKHTVHIGYLPIQVGVAYYRAPTSNFLPPFIQKIADSIAGRSVSLIRILLSSVLLLLGFISVTVLIYTTIRSSMASLGRNPLAAHVIYKSLYQAGLIALTVVGGTLLASYLVLRI